MGFTLSLSDYVDQTSTDLLTAVQFGAETAAMMNLQTGIKSSAALQLLSTNSVPQAGETCGFNASGDVTFSQRNLTTVAIKFQDTLCPRALQAKWTQLLLKKGQQISEADIPKIIVDNIIGGIKQRLETADWQGDTNSPSQYLLLYDGIIKTITGATGEVVATASTYNSTNARAIVKNIISNIPAALKGNSAVKIFMGYDAAEIYRQALMDANLYHVAVGSGDQKNIMAEGSVHEIVPVHGLDGLYSVSGQNCIFAFHPDNVFLGVDMENEEEQAKLWYSADDDNVKYSFRFRRGWQIAYPAEIVRYANS